MKNLLEQFTKERLEVIANFHSSMVLPPSHAEIEALAQIALAAMEGKYPAIPAGWKLVPIEATPEMLNESWVKCAIHHPTAYRVMIAAAPQPE